VVCDPWKIYHCFRQGAFAYSTHAKISFEINDLQHLKKPLKSMTYNT
jgi:hypothetical protein